VRVEIKEGRGGLEFAFTVFPTTRVKARYDLAMAAQEMKLVVEEAGRGGGWFETVMQTLEAAFWPGVILVAVLLFRPQLGYLISELARLIGRTKEVSYGKDGLSVKTELSATRGEVQAMSVVLEKMARSEGPLKAEFAAVDSRQRLRDLAEEYEKGVNDSDAKVRGMKRSKLADGLADVASSSGLGVPELAGLAGDYPNAAVAAIATMVMESPEANAWQILRPMSKNATFLHARYRLSLAIIRLSRSRALSRSELIEAQVVTAGYLLDKVKPADKPLSQILRSASDAVEVALAELGDR
jgi:hypothetical protein